MLSIKDPFVSFSKWSLNTQNYNHRRQSSGSVDSVFEFSEYTFLVFLGDNHSEYIMPMFRS